MALEMSETKIIKPSTEAMSIMMRRYLLPTTGAYDTVKSNPSRM